MLLMQRKSTNDVGTTLAGAAAASSHLPSIQSCAVTDSKLQLVISCAMHCWLHCRPTLIRSWSTFHQPSSCADAGSGGAFSEPPALLKLKPRLQ
jgi:hypothetical protein